MSVLAETRPGAPGARIFDRQTTARQARDFLDQSLATTGSYWNFGQFQQLGAAVPELRSGLFYLVAPENVGKSIVMTGLSWEILRANNRPATQESPESTCFWMDLSLDDPMPMRYSYLMARVGELPISLAVRAGSFAPEDRELLVNAVLRFNDRWGEQHRIYATQRKKDGQYVEPPRSVERIMEMIREARKQIGTTAKLLVTIDGFHDIRLEGRSQDENDKQKQISAQLKETAHAADALALVTAHCRKGSRKRGTDADMFKGNSDVLYDAMVVATLFSDVNVNRDAAEIYWIDENDPTAEKKPVLELDIQKNKAGSFKDVLFYNLVKERAWAYEVPYSMQERYRKTIYGD